MFVESRRIEEIREPKISRKGKVDPGLTVQIWTARNLCTITANLFLKWRYRRVFLARFEEPFFFLYYQFSCSKWLIARLPHIECIRMVAVRSTHLPLKMHYVGLRALKSPYICNSLWIASTFLVLWLFRVFMVKRFIAKVKISTPTHQITHKLKY